MFCYRDEEINELIKRAELVLQENNYLKTQLQVKQNLIDNLKANADHKQQTSNKKKIIIFFLINFYKKNFLIIAASTLLHDQSLVIKTTQLTNELDQLKMIHSDLQLKYKECALKLNDSISLRDYEHKIAELKS